MIPVQVLQGSPEWHALRLGVLTASRASNLLTPAKLTLSKSRDALMAKLLHEWLTGASAEEFGGNKWTEHGHEHEGAAGDWFASVTGEQLERIGFVFRDDTRTVGCSPDLWRPGEYGVELKCPAGWTHIQWLADGGVPREYVMQVQFSLWVTHLPRWYFMSYAASPSDGWLAPWKPGAYLPPLLVEVAPDARYQDALSEHVPTFVAEMLERREQLLALGARRDWSPSEAA